MKNLKIPIKIYTFVCLGLIFYGFVLFIGIVKMRDIRAEANKIETALIPALDLILQIDRDMQQALVAERSILQLDKQSKTFQVLHQKHSENLRQINERFAKYEKLIYDESEKAEAYKFLKLANIWIEFSQELVKQNINKSNGEVFLLNSSLNEGSIKFEEAREIIDKLGEYKEKQIKEYSEHIESNYSASLQEYTVNGAFMLMMILPISIFLVRSLKKPLNELNEAAANIAKGNLSFNISINQSDEIGILADSFKIMQQNLKEEKVRSEESNQLKAAFLQNISHEIRTPLNGIIGCASVIANEQLSKEELDEFTDLLRKSSNRLIENVHNILDLAKLETNQHSLNSTYFSVSKLLDDLYSTYLKDARSKNIDFRINIEEECEDLEIFTDESIINQILGNFINNAIKFTNIGYIELGCRYEQNNIVLWVQDTGIGVPKDFHNSIFGNFNQVDSSISRDFEGCGLGLAIAIRLAKLIEAEITIDSELQKGSTFSLILKNVNKSKFANSLTNDFMTNFDYTNSKVLIAEDNPINFLLLERILKKHNIKVLHAENGKKAIELVSKNSDIILILMDIKMPEMDGYEASKKIKELYPNIPIIAQTAFSIKDNDSKMTNNYFDGILFKPFREEDVFQHIGQFIKL